MTITQAILHHESRGKTEFCVACGKSEGVRFLSAPDPSFSLVWLENPPPPDRMGEHYGEDYDRSVSTAGEDPNRWTDRLKELSKHKSGGAILDLGCSAGGFLEGLKGSNWDLYGIEMSEVVADKARSRTGAKVFVGDILEAPFSPGSFDAITCFHVLEHLYQPREVLAKVSDWLKPGGIFYMMVPNIDSAGRRIFGSYWYALELPRHLFHFSPKSLRAMAHSVGLDEVSVTTDREVFIEASTGYILDEKLHKTRLKRTPLARRPQPRLPFKVVRKAFRLTALPALNALASFAGDGESIHAIFRKGTAR
jgi:2-polyprenyl-3-methyl-5-hydroxy-6-metoxy-1,4-benzoquinol methylase